MDKYETLAIEKISSEVEMKKKNQALAYLFILMIFNGVIISLPDSGTGWCLGLLLLLPVIYPSYLIKHKGFKYGRIIFIKSLGVFLLAVVLSVASQSISAIILKTQQSVNY